MKILFINQKQLFIIKNLYTIIISYKPKISNNFEYLKTEQNSSNKTNFFITSEFCKIRDFYNHNGRCTTA